LLGFLSDQSCMVSLSEARFVLGSWIGKHEH
jgi:hypothetical protein